MPEERLSAVAKRRRLHGNSPGTATSSKNTSRSQSPVTSFVRRETSDVPDIEVAVRPDEVSNTNTFSALVTQDVVQFSNFREIERLSATATKVRLSKGQKCLISGRYSLWVKEGLIGLLGAKLEPSPQIYHVHSSTLFEIPALVAVTHIAEFEVYSIDDQALGWLGFAPFRWTLQSAKEVYTTSHLIHGYSISTESDGQHPVREVDGSSVLEVARQLTRFQSAAKDTSSAITLLTCGKQFTSVGMLFSWILNSIVTSTDRKRTRYFSQGILVLDLDSDMPTFGPPGTVAMVHVTSPVLGTRFTQPASLVPTQNSGVFAIIKMQLASVLQDSQRKVSQLNSFLEFFRQIRRQQLYSQCPLIIKANNWLEDLEFDHARALAERFALDFVVCHGAEAASNSGQLGAFVATESRTCQLINIPVTSSRDLPAHVQTELDLQSYFHFQGHHLGRPQWTCLPLELDSQSKLWLNYGTESAFLSGILVSGEWADRSELVDNLNGCIVAIVLQNDSAVAISGETVPQNPSNHNNFANGRQNVPAIDELECVGLGVVAGVEVSKNRICLLSPIPQQLLNAHEERGNRVILVAVRADSDGGFDTSWLQLELGSIFPEKQLSKTVHRRKLNIQQ